MEVFEKKGFWKISGRSKKYNTKEEAMAAAGISEPVVEPETLPQFDIEIDPLEALRQARSERDGSIEKGCDYESSDDEGELFEGTDPSVFGAAGD